MKKFALSFFILIVACLFLEIARAQASQPVASIRTSGMLAATAPTQVPSTLVTTANSSQPLFFQKFMRDPLANSIAVIVLIGMIASLVALAYRFLNPPEEADVSQSQAKPPAKWRDWVVPVLSLLGLVVAGYLTYVELSHSTAICGPVGNCNSVQTSKYATLWGFLPVGVFGMIGYIAIAISWFVHQFTSDAFKTYSSLVIWGMALLGVLFSIYLTFLEPFVIGATCAWCISSAIIITLLLWSTTGLAIQASSELSGGEDD